MERYKPRCSADHWQECLVAMNEPKDIVILSLVALEDVVRCHRRTEGWVSRDLIVREGRVKVHVRRNQLWDLVQAHGKVCEPRVSNYEEYHR